MKSSKSLDREKKVTSLARQICDATIDAATIEYTKTIIDIDTVSIEQLKARLAELKRGPAQWPKFETRKTVATVSSGRGSFKW